MQEQYHNDHSPAMNHSRTPPLHDTITEWVLHGSALSPDAPAVRYGAQMLTYRQLDGFSNRIANALVGSGVRHGDRVGIGLERSIEMVAAVVGILKCGAAYVPLDPAYPADRLAMMQEDADLRLLLLHAVHENVFARASCPVHLWEAFEQEASRASSEPPQVEIDPETVAYVIFTSGSTGRPKGIAMPHRALSNLIEWQLERKTFKPGARVLQYSSISFDVSFQEIATTLASGGALHLIADEERRDPRRLLRILIEDKIERLFLPYVAMRGMIETARVLDVHPEDLKEVITAGEQLRVDGAVRSFFAGIGGASLDNQYGPSETHVITAHLLEGDPAAWPDLPPIGRPLKNCDAYILNDDMEPVPTGQPGELYLAGRNLALGYINREDKTREVFITSPFDDPECPLLYKTGDLAAYTDDGIINFLGRKDHQVKIRGHRVEPGEINNAVSRFPGIEQCLTHPVSGKSGGIRLASWYVVKNGASVDPAALRRHLADTLPDYMVPVFLIAIAQVPYTPSGKVDMKALPVPSFKEVGFAREDFAYVTETEKALAAIWGEVLEQDDIPRTIDFFELGGDSLRAVTLFLRIRQRFNLDLPLATIVQSSTIERLANRIDQGAGLKDFRSLQLMQPGAERAVPLFLVHGGKGNVLAYSNLVQNLGPELPIYGLQWPGWDGRPGPRTIPDMARFYTDEILRVLPGKSCRLGGYCIGGLIILEMAMLLRKEGIDIEGPLLVWDAPNMHSRTYCPQEPWGREDQLEALERLKADLLQRTELPGSEPISVQPESRSQGFIGVLQRLPYLRRLVQWGKARIRLLPVVFARLSGRDVPMELREYHCLATMLSAVRKYTCPICTEHVLYFRSFSVLARDLVRMQGWWDDPWFGFAELCGGRFDTCVIGGRHNTLLEVPKVADIVREAHGLDELDKKDSKRSIS